MNKKRVDKWILTAKDAIVKVGISKDGKVERSFRGQISSFGSAVILGSFKSAAAFFVKPGEASVHRELLLVAMYYIVNNEIKESDEVLDYICKNDSAELKEKFIDAAIALKLALNFFDLVESKKNEES
jgi:CRISPR-associated protein Cmr5